MENAFTAALLVGDAAIDSKVDQPVIKASSNLPCDSLLLEEDLMSKHAAIPVEPTEMHNHRNFNISLAPPSKVVGQINTDQNLSSIYMTEDNEMCIGDISSMSPLPQRFFLTAEPTLHASTTEHSSAQIPIIIEAKNVAEDSIELRGEKPDQGQKYQNLCRICADQNTGTIPLFHGEGLLLSLVEKVHRCLPIKVSDSDDLPHQICKNCASKLETSDDFIKTSIAGNAKLLALSMAWTEVDQQNETHQSSTTIDAAIPVTEHQEGDKEGIQETNKAATNQVKQLHCDSAGVNHVLTKLQTSVQKQRQWSCPKCDYKASRKSSLLLHERCKHSVNKFKKRTRDVVEAQDSQVDAVFVCGYCDKSFPSETKREKHMHTHTRLAMQRSMKVCNLCSAGFPNVKSLREHLKNVHSVKNERKYSCDKCDKSYSILGSLDIHRATHSNETPYLCDTCGKSFKHASNLRCHKRSHAEWQLKHRHACDICPKSFPSKFHLSEHKNVHLGITPYSCEICDKKFHRRLQLRQHRFVHSSEKAYECPQCGASFNRRSNMKQHMKTHVKEQKFICKVCKESFPTFNEVQQHHRKHASPEQVDDCNETEKEVLSCSKCLKLFSSSKLLQEHLKTHRAAKVQCAFCSKELSSLRTLDYHVRSFHTGERPYPCQLCSESFLSRESCTVHERIHTGEKPYSCTVCQMSFRCASNLAQHMGTHRDDRPWACDHCPKRFKRKGILDVHMRTHTGEKPYCCDICGRRFSQKNDMIKHQQTHMTAKQTYVCCNCNWPFPSRKELNKHHLTHHRNQKAAQIETVTNCVPTLSLPSQSQTLLITDDLCQFPITILEDRSNVIVHHIEDTDKHTQIVGVNPGGEPNSQIVHFSDSLFHAVVTEPQVLQLQSSDGQQTIQYDTGYC